MTDRERLEVASELSCDIWIVIFPPASIIGETSTNQPTSETRHLVHTSKLFSRPPNDAGKMGSVQLKQPAQSSSSTSTLRKTEGKADVKAS